MLYIYSKAAPTSRYSMPLTLIKPGKMEPNERTALLHQFNTTIDEWIAGLEEYTLEMLCRRPRPGSWSLGQVYIHLAEETHYFIEQLNICLYNDDNSEKEMQATAKHLFRNNELPDQLIKGPAVNVKQPQSKEALLQMLVTLKEKVNILCGAFDISGSSGKTKHPGFLFLNATEWLQLAEMHLRHHFRQRQRIMEQLFLLTTNG